MRDCCIRLLVICFVLLCSCKQQNDTKTLRLAHGLDVTHPVHKGMVFMAKRVQEKSNGKLKVQIYPSEQLGSERECLEMLQIGSLDITKVSAAVLEGFVPEYKVLGLPYLFRDIEHNHKVLDGEIGKEILLAGQQYWLRGLAFYDAGSRSFYTVNKPILKPEDLIGMKIRVLESITAIRMIEVMGGKPDPIAWGELYTALQSGTVDGAENNPPSFYLSHHYEICKYYSLDEHTTIPDVLLVGLKTWKKLSETEQQWLQEAVDESVPVQRKYWTEKVEVAMQEIQKAGVKVYNPDKEPFAKAVEDIYNYYKNNDPLIYGLIKKIKAVE